ncbi:MAG TPA: MBL fold metallo-hydrolase [Gemmatimonadaceae bacterium]|nr:MBL fold metallo-hydrolase [Gemmatimonadaceae bacterium]
MRIASETVGPFQENAYLVVDDAARRAVLIDPGDEPARLLDMIARAGAELDAIWLTHAHLDHVGAINAVRRVHPVPVYLHPLDCPLYDRAAEVAAMYGLPFDQPDPPDRELADGDTLSVGALRFRVMHVPGHAPGHVLFHGHGVALGGDLLFRGSVGRTDLPFSDGNAMEASLARVSTLPEETQVYPGHGPPTTIGAELAENPFLNGTAMPVRR